MKAVINTLQQTAVCWRRGCELEQMGAGLLMALSLGPGVWLPFNFTYEIQEKKVRTCHMEIYSPKQMSRHIFLHGDISEGADMLTLR